MGKGKSLQKSLRICLSSVRKAMQVEALRQHSIPAGITTTRLLSSCKYPRTQSFAPKRHAEAFHDVGGGGGGGRAATLDDVDRFLFENFNSLYTRRSSGRDGGGLDDPREEKLLDRCSPIRRKAAGPPRDAAQCFNVLPGLPNSSGEEARRSTTSSTSSSHSDSSSSSSSSSSETRNRMLHASDSRKTSPAARGDSVAVMTFTKDPYEDFRRSMEEMVEARHEDPREPLDWDFMEELLISHLELNDRSLHKHILGAFTDIAVDFRRRRPTPCDRAKVPPPPSLTAETTTGGRRNEPRWKERDVTSTMRELTWTTPERPTGAASKSR